MAHPVTCPCNNDTHSSLERFKGKRTWHRIVGHEVSGAYLVNVHACGAVDPGQTFAMGGDRTAEILQGEFDHLVNVCKDCDAIVGLQ